MRKTYYILAMLLLTVNVVMANAAFKTKAISYSSAPLTDPCALNGFIDDLGGFHSFVKKYTSTAYGNQYNGLYEANVCVGVTFTLGTLGSNPLNPSYSWDFGDGASTTGIPVSHSYSTPGNYTITVTASGSECTAVTQTISVSVTTYTAEIYIKSQKYSKSCSGYPMTISTAACSDANATFSYNFGDGTTGVGSPVDVVHTYSSPGSYNVIVTITSPSFPTYVTSLVIVVEDCTEITACKDCLGSFSPEAGDYVISLWVKEQGTGLTKTTYNKAGIKISFDGDPTIYGPFYPDVTKNKIIDGWQRIEESFQVPTGITKINIELINDNLSDAGIDCYFDDIRIHPFDASMKSYVYDPVTLRLSAELDERNYATFYEYDEEGKLIRVKKETERGIMTVKEARNNTKKK